MSPNSGIEKKLDSIASAVKSLDKTSGKTAREQSRDRRRIPFDVDLLTNEEVASLKQLIVHESNILAYYESQLESGGDTVKGMYTEFDRLNLIMQAADGRCIAVLPMAHWAVEKYEQRERDVREDKAAQWKHDIVVAFVSTAIGGVLGIAGTLLGALLS